jgi:enoyl-CoA hydratase
MAPATIAVEERGRVGILTLQRPEALNALNAQVLAETVEATRAFDERDDIGAVLLRGSERAFAAGADIREMADVDARTALVDGLLAGWDAFARTRTPVVAAVRGYALGGGCELAMMCDVIVAGEGARFGQPEITLGVIPGMGGTQRLTRAVGKAKAMDLVLTGRMMDAREAEASGLVSRVVPDAAVDETAFEVAELIASRSLPVAYQAKAAVLAAFETTLAQGLLVERQAFHAGFALDDQTEGMAAFLEKRSPEFRHR